MTRREDWTARLHAEIEAARDRPFVWGHHDCCQWVGRCIEAMTGTNPAGRWTGRATTARGAARIMRRLGGMRSAWGAVLGAEIPVAMAGRGDAVIVRGTDGTDAIGVVDLSGEHAAFVAPGLGLSFVPLASATVAWRV